MFSTSCLTRYMMLDGQSGVYSADNENEEPPGILFCLPSFTGYYVSIPFCPVQVYNVIFVGVFPGL